MCLFCCNPCDIFVVIWSRVMACRCFRGLTWIGLMFCPCAIFNNTKHRNLTLNVYPCTHRWRWATLWVGVNILGKTWERTQGVVFVVVLISSDLRENLKPKCLSLLQLGLGWVLAVGNRGFLSQKFNPVGTYYREQVFFGVYNALLL